VAELATETVMLADKIKHARWLTPIIVTNPLLKNKRALSGSLTLLP
jgi:hypothetical protein